jgi:serine/threonine protein kinase
MKTPAQRLVGEKLDGDWTVVEHLDLQNITSGGHFSESYVVQHASGRKAFLKALDYERVLKFATDPAARLHELTQSYLYERTLLFRCRDRNLDRVVMPVSDGTVRLEGAGGLSGGVVQYLILELGDGDLRVQAVKAMQLDEAWTFRALHHIATGLNQLHGQRIAHQDLKPSNVVVFAAAADTGAQKSRTFKVSDLGSATARDLAAPHDHYDLLGDPTYAPVELLYKHIDPDWDRRRFGCDIYLLGSMVAFCFSGLGITSLIQHHLAPDHSWHKWNGPYRDVLPHIYDVFDRVVDDATGSVRQELRSDVAEMVRELCDPDPLRRGDPASRGYSGTQYRLNKYVTRLDRFAHRAEVALAGEVSGH